MSGQIKKWCRGLFSCLLVTLILNTEALALDRRASYTLSHYIMAVMYDELNDVNKAVQEYKKALKADSGNSVIHLNLASSYIKNNEIQKAIQELNLAAKFDPQAIEPHAILALLYSSENKIEQAGLEYEAALTNASKLQPENTDIYRSLGSIYLQQKKFKEAEKTYRLILSLLPTDAQAHFYLGSIYEELKDRGKAEEELKKALELKPDYHETLNYLGYLYVEAEKNLDLAEAMIRKALSIEPDNGAYIDSLGWLYFKQGKLKEAIQQLEKAITLLEDPVIYDHLGDAYKKAGEIEKAGLSWQKSLELEPGQEQLKKKIENLTKGSVPNSKLQNQK